MYTEDRITIAAPVRRVYELAAAIDRWPEILPHYRWVAVLRDLPDRGDARQRLVEMAATRDGFPVKWVSIQELDPGRREVRYRHVRGVTRGMDVIWALTTSPDAGGREGTAVRLIHLFDPPWPRPLGPLVARYIVGGLFVHDIATKTLRRIKDLAETETETETEAGLEVGGTAEKARQPSGAASMAR